MERPKNKAALLDTLRRERAFWEALVAIVPEEDMLVPGATGDWTFKDVVVHLTYWRKQTVARLATALQGAEPLSPEREEEVQATNEWVYNANRERPLAEVLAESHEVWQQLADVVEALPEADLMEPGRFPWMEGRALGHPVLTWSYAHLHEHASYLNDWLARTLDVP